MPLLLDPNLQNRFVGQRAHLNRNIECILKRKFKSNVFIHTMCYHHPWLQADSGSVGRSVGALPLWSYLSAFTFFPKAGVGSRSLNMVAYLLSI